MAKVLPPAPESHKVAEITDREIDAAVDAVVDAVLAGLPSEAFTHAEGAPVDTGELLPTNSRMAETLTIHERAWKRNTVRTAILLAHPAEG